MGGDCPLPEVLNTPLAVRLYCVMKNDELITALGVPCTVTVQSVLANCKLITIHVK